MTDRLAELGALQYAVENLSTAGTNPNRLGLAGYIHAAYTDYQAWAAANPGVNPNRLSARGRLYGYFHDYGFSPLNLFSSGEVGVWYDPSDLTTMFQDRGGTKQVTADGQTVGLILDKSKGIGFGANLITSPETYSMTPGGSTPPTVSTTTQGGESCIKIATNVSGAQSYSTTRAVGDYTASITQANTLQKMSIRIFLSRALVGTETVTIYEQGTQGPIYSCSSSFLSNQWVDVSSTGFRTTTMASNIAVYLEGTFTGGALDIYVRQFSLTDWVGNHAVAPSDAARPLKTSTGAADWTNYDAVDDVLNTTFPSSLGSSCTVCRANVGGAPTILTGQTIGTSYADSTDNAGLIIINRALTSQETTDVTAWLTAKGAT